MKKKLLKLNKPMIYCYTVCGTIFSIIEKKDMPWIYSNMIQIMYHSDWKMFIFEDQKNLLENCPFIKTEYIFFDEKRFMERSFIDTITYIIDNDYYVYLFLDWKYIIPEAMRHNLAHTTLISGYDKEKQIFYLSDNYDNGKFITLEIDMYIVQKAFQSAWTASVGNSDDNDNTSAFSYLKCITAFKYDNSVYTKFCPHTFVRQLTDFINSKSVYIFENQNTKFYGYSSYELIKEFLLGKADYTFEYKNFHLLYEHKFLMQNRIKYMIDNNMIISNRNYLETAVEISNDFLVARNLFLKSQLMNEKNKEVNIKKICNIIDISKEKEKKLFQELIDGIKGNS